MFLIYLQQSFISTISKTRLKCVFGANQGCKTLLIKLGEKSIKTYFNIYIGLFTVYFNNIFFSLQNLYLTSKFGIPDVLFRVNLNIYLNTAVSYEDAKKIICNKSKIFTQRSLGALRSLQNSLPFIGDITIEVS